MPEWPSACALCFERFLFFFNEQTRNAGGNCYGFYRIPLGAPVADSILLQYTTTDVHGEGIKKAHRTFKRLPMDAASRHSG